MPKGLQAKGLARRDKMLLAAITHFLADGYEKTTTASIAKSAGMSASSFFAAFETKEALLLLLVKHMFSNQFNEIFSIIGSSAEPDVEFIPYIDQELVLICPQDHPLAVYREVDLAEAAKYPMVHFIEECSMRKFINSMFCSVGDPPPIACEVENDMTVASMVNNGMGFAVVPYEHFLRSYNVRIIPIKNPQYKLYIYLAYLKDYELPQMARAFRDWALKKSKLNLEKLPPQVICADRKN